MRELVFAHQPQTAAVRAQHARSGPNAPVPLTGWQDGQNMFYANPRPAMSHTGGKDPGHLSLFPPSAISLPRPPDFDATE